MHKVLAEVLRPAAGRGGKDSATSRQVKPIEAYALILMVIFTTELTVMEVFYPMFQRIGTLAAALADATLLAVASALPLWIIFSPVFIGPRRRSAAARRDLVRAFVQLVVGFLSIELVVMLVLPGLLGGANPVVLNLIDAVATVLFTAPLLWWLFGRIERAQHQVSFANLLDSPQLLYLLLLYVVFLAALLHDLVLPELPGVMRQNPRHVLDAFLLTAFLAPFLWLFVARPLRRSLQFEQVRAQTIYQQVVDAVMMTDADGRIETINPSAVKLFGYGEEELIGQPIKLLLEKPLLGLDMPVGTDPGGNLACVFSETNGWNRSGRTLALDVSVSRLVMNGSDGYLLILRDVGERRDAERAVRESDIRFREVFEQSEDAILFFKPCSDYVLDANATAEQLFVYSKSELKGRGLERLFQGQHLARVQNAINKVSFGETVQLDNLVGLRGDHAECIVSLRIKYIALQGIQLLYCTLRDVTERVRLEQEARDVQARLIQANKMTSLGLMVSGVAHEVNNPNNLILNNAQLLSAQIGDATRVLREHYRENGDFLLGGVAFSELEDEMPQLVDGIIDGSLRIAKIVGELKNYSRLDPTGIESSVNLNDVAITSIYIMQQELVRASSNFRYALADDLPSVMGNSQQLSQVVINLLMNAAQALPSRDHGIRLATAYDPVADQVHLSVADDGVGISPEVGTRIMEPFFTTRLDRGGTGLGLSISRSIIVAHRGVLEFASTPGNGSIFTVKIPVCREPSEDHA